MGEIKLSENNKTRNPSWENLTHTQKPQSQLDLMIIVATEATDASLKEQPQKKPQESQCAGMPEALVTYYEN